MLENKENLKYLGNDFTDFGINSIWKLDIIYKADIFMNSIEEAVFVKIIFEFSSGEQY